MKRISILILATAFAMPSLLHADDFDVVEAWEKDCSKCHADDGSGLTKKGRRLRLRDYRKAEVQAELKDEEMAKAIADGVVEDGEEKMNAYAEDYTPEQIEAFITYIRSMARG